MNISSFVLRIIFLAIPGIVALKVYSKLKEKRIKKDWQEFTEILVLSLISYATYEIINMFVVFFKTGKINFSIGASTIFNSFINENAGLNWIEIFITAIIGVILAFLLSYINEYKVINKFGKLIRATKSTGEDDVWCYFHDKLQIDWVIVRDHKLKLYYYCWIKMFSESNEKRELLLMEVSVYNQDGDFCYNSNSMYLSRDFYDLTIEVHCMNNDNNNENFECK